MLARRACRSLFAFVVLCNAGALAAPTDLDVTYGVAGVARLDGPFLWAHAPYPDGRIALVVGNDQYVPQYSITPRRVIRLDTSGRGDASFAPIDNFDAFTIESVGVAPSGRLMTLQSFYATPRGAFRATRHHIDGTTDLTFGEGGFALVSEFGYIQHARFPDGELIQTPIVVGKDEEMHVGIRGFANLGLGHSSWIDRVDARGMPVDRLDHQLAGFLLYQSLLLDGQDRLVALVYRTERAFGGVDTTGPALIRFVDGAPDQAFGIRGLAYQPILDWSDAAYSIGSAYRGHAETPDGGYVVVGRLTQGLRSDVLAVVKFTSQGLFDRSFGNHGIARIRFASTDTATIRAAIAVQPDGDIVVAAWVLDQRLSFIGLARLTRSGQRDARFAPGGVATFWADEGAQGEAVYVQPDGRIVVVGAIHDGGFPGIPTPAVFRFNGGDLTQERPLRERIAVEYFHAAFGHYFLTADGHEIHDLDTNPASGWSRTGKSFAVWDENDGSLAPTCRFWSDQSFAPKSSHVYTPYADECALLKVGATWKFERNAFMLRLPAQATGECDDDARPLYRAYNNAMGGAPNHRYTVDVAVVDEMVALGWTAEGAAGTRVFACLPRP